MMAFDLALLGPLLRHCADKATFSAKQAGSIALGAPMLVFEIIGAVLPLMPTTTL